MRSCVTSVVLLETLKTLNNINIMVRTTDDIFVIVAGRSLLEQRSAFGDVAQYIVRIRLRSIFAHPETLLRLEQDEKAAISTLKF